MLRLAGFALLGVCWAAPVEAQSRPETPPAAPATAPLPIETTPTMPARVLTDMPSAGSLNSLIETIPADVVSSRIDGGGMYAGTSARIGAHGSSWTQTRFRVGDINIGSPDGSGTPLTVPGVLEWDSVDVNTGPVGIEANTPGIVVDLTPRRPTRTWLRQVELSGGPSVLASGGNPTLPPAIARLNSYGSTSVLLSGPLRDRLGLVFAGTYTHASRFERESPTVLDGSIGSAFAHLVYTASPRDEVRTVLWAQRSTTPIEHPLMFAKPGAQADATSLSWQTTWERRGAAGEPSWRGYGGLTSRHREPEMAPAAVVSLERLQEAPPWEQINQASGTERLWQIGGTMKPAEFERFGHHHDASMGVDLSGGVVTRDAWFTGQIGELVNGLPARVWDFKSPASGSRWQQTTVAAYVADRLLLRPGLTGTLGLRFEHVGASADGAANGVGWTNLLPRLGARWSLTDDGRLLWFANYGRYGNQMRLSDLAYGDPSAPVANVYRWIAPPGTTVPQASARGPLVKRWGPGTGGDPNFSAIAPDLERPHMNEIVTGFEFHPAPAWVARLSAIARIDKGLLALTNRGVPFTAYTTSLVIDPGVDVVGGTTVQPLPIYNRPTSTFGADQYLVTNSGDSHTTFTGVDVAVRATTARLLFLMGGTAGRSEGWASNRGFDYDENDATLLGEVFVDPNANTFAKGRTFTERGYTLHLSGAYQFAHDLRLGVAARYQDGQHFSRMVMATGLNQGPELVRGFANGQTRFSFTCTVDTRLQKGFDVAGRQVVAFVDVFNLLNLGLEVEEFTVTGPTSRMTSAVQPPRALHLGLRFGF